MGLIGGTAGGWLGILLARSLVSLVSRTISDLYVPIETITDGSMSHIVSLLRVPASVWIHGGLLGMAVSVMGAVSPSLDASRTAPARAVAPGEYEAGHEGRAVALLWVGLAMLLGAGVLAMPGPVGGIPLFGSAPALCLLSGHSCMTPALVRRFGTLLSGRSGTGLWRGPLIAVVSPSGDQTGE